MFSKFSRRVLLFFFFIFLVKVTYAVEAASGLNDDSLIIACDFDGNGEVGISDFLLFVNHFGLSRSDEKYDERYDLDNNDIIGISDFLIFVDNFGKQVPQTPTPPTFPAADTFNTFDNAVAEIKRLKSILTENWRLIDEEVTAKAINHPLRAPKDQFETTDEYNARLERLSSILDQFRIDRTEYYEIRSIQHQIVQLYNKAFVTNDFTVKLQPYNADGQYFRYRVSSPRPDYGFISNVGILRINREDARSLYNNWDKVTQTSYYSISPHYGRELAWIRLKNPVDEKIYTLDFRVRRALSPFILEEYPTAVAFSRDGKYVAIGESRENRSLWGPLSLWKIDRTPTDDPMWSTDLQSPVESIAFSPDGKHIAGMVIGYDYYLYILSVRNGAAIDRVKLLPQPNFSSVCKSITYSPGGYKIVAALHESVYIWDLNSKKVTTFGTSDYTQVNAVAFSPDGKYLAVGDAAGSIYVIDTSTLTLPVSEFKYQRIDVGGSITDVDFSPNGSFLAVARDNDTKDTIKIFLVEGIKRHELMNTIRTTGSYIYNLAYSPDGSYIAITNYWHIEFYQDLSSFPKNKGSFLKYRRVYRTGGYRGRVGIAWSPSGNSVSDGRAIYYSFLFPVIEK